MVKKDRQAVKSGSWAASGTAYLQVRSSLTPLLRCVSSPSASSAAPPQTWFQCAPGVLPHARRDRQQVAVGAPGGALPKCRHKKCCKLPIRWAAMAPNRSQQRRRLQKEDNIDTQQAILRHAIACIWFVCHCRLYYPASTSIHKGPTMSVQVTFHQLQEQLPALLERTVNSGGRDAVSIAAHVKRLTCAPVALCRSPIRIRTTGLTTFDGVPPLPVSSVELPSDVPQSVRFA
jgi:hypothetical protein